MLLIKRDLVSLIQEITVTTKDINFHCLASGNGRLILCLHGFPDTPHVFIPFMKALSNQGFRIIAPYLRGYHPTSKPKDGNYSLQSQANDIVSLITALNDSAIVIGHDWSGISAQLAAIQNPDKFSHFICVSIPIYKYARINLKQLCKSWYIFIFYLPYIPEFICRIKHFKFLLWLTSRWSPSYTWLQDMIDARVKCFAHNSLKPALHYYRQIHEINFTELYKPIVIPTLTLAGEQDGCIDISSFDNVPNVTKMMNVGHYPHLEDTPKFTKHILNFIA